MTDIDCRDYKSVTLVVPIGVVGTSANCKLQASAAVGGPYTDIPGAAITAVTVTATVASTLDAVMPVGKPYAQIVLVTVGATTVAGAVLFGRGSMSTSRV